MREGAQNRKNDPSEGRSPGGVGWHYLVAARRGGVGPKQGALSWPRQCGLSEHENG